MRLSRLSIALLILLIQIPSIAMKVFVVQFSAATSVEETLKIKMHTLPDHPEGKHVSVHFLNAHFLNECFVKF